MNNDSLLTLFAGADLVVDADGPDPVVVQFGDAVHVDVPDEPLALLFAAVGMPGRDGASTNAEAVAAADLAAGVPVAVDRATGKFVAADAAWKPIAFAAGLLSAGVAEGFVGSATTGRLTLADWTAATGTAQLSPGVSYFLAAGGGLTPVPPASACVALIGKALNPTTLLIDPQPPIER